MSMTNEAFIYTHTHTYINIYLFPYKVIFYGNFLRRRCRRHRVRYIFGFTLRVRPRDRWRIRKFVAGFCCPDRFVTTVYYSSIRNFFLKEELFFELSVIHVSYETMETLFVLTVVICIFLRKPYKLIST